MLPSVSCGRSRGRKIGPSLGPTMAAACGCHLQLIATAKLNDIDPQAWLADVLARLPDHPARRIHEIAA